MYLLGQAQAFYKAPPYPPWATLPLEALSPELRNSTTPLPDRPSSISERSGAFIPLLHHEGTEPDTRFIDPHTTVGKQHDIYLFNGKHPVSFQLFKWDSVRTKWGGQHIEGSNKKKQKVDWIDGFRWSCMETYLKHLHAFST